MKSFSSCLSFGLIASSSSFACAWNCPSSTSVRNANSLVLAMSSSSSSESTTTTTTTRQPRLPLPQPLRSTTPGTWAYDTMSRRVDEEILARTVADNQAWLDQHADIAQRVEALRQELRQAAPLQYPEKPPPNDPERMAEYEQWTAFLKPHVDQNETWLSAPWMVAEFYVYRRLMDAWGYWDKNSASYLHDPFRAQKQAGLTSSTKSAEAMLQRIPHLPATAEGEQVAFSMALWGNKMDLSLWPADASGENTDVFSGVLAAAHENLLCDDSQALSDWCDRLRNQGGGTVDLIVDNAGFELVTDLALAQYLIQAGIAKKVRLQCKSHPTFVSDALPKDVRETVAYYRTLDTKEFPAAQAAGDIWQSYLDTGKWEATQDNFWVQGAAMWKMRNDLYQHLHTSSDLAVVKGDANYRRLLGDLQWHYDAPFEDVVGAYFPCPVVALRTLKAELGCGMSAEQTKRAAEMDKNWLVNGRFGVVQFSKARRGD